MSTKDCLEIIYWIVSLGILITNVYFIANGPRNAISIGRKLNIEQQKDDAKRELFLTLFSLRGSPLHYDFVRALNEIDVVFEDTPSVLQAWHTYYDSLHIKGRVNEDQEWELQRVTLLSAMAQSLGYQSIRETDMIRQYYPEGHGNQLQSDLETHQDWKTYLKKNIEFLTIMINLQKNNRLPKTDENE